MNRRELLKTSAPALALPALYASDTAAEPYPTELTVQRVTESACWLRGIRTGDLVVVYSQPGYRCDSTYLDPNGRAVVVQHMFADGIRVHIPDDTKDDCEMRFDIIAEGLTKEDLAAAGYQFIVATFYQLKSGTWHQAHFDRGDDGIEIVEHMDVETVYEFGRL